MEKLLLNRGESCYYAENQDAEVVSSLCDIKSFSIRTTKYSVFAKSDLARVLPILVRHGYRVEFRDIEE